ncbi:MAG TPA: hypothetical protein VHC95_10050 [Opitutales bacterium]|nr:hypothetical protein [Opitutales bacterium]
MKKALPLALLALGLFSGGCAVGVPISPLMFLLKDQPAPLHRPTPDAPEPVPAAPTAPQVSGNDTTGAV